MKFVILTVAALAACAGATKHWPKKTCNAIVIGAQGAQQSYVTGALAVLAATGTKYDVVVSTSASIVAAQAAATSSTPQWVAAAAISMLSVTAGQCFTEWPKGEVDGIEHQGGLFNASVSDSLYKGILRGGRRVWRAPKVVAVAVSLTTTLQVPLEVTTSNVDASVSALRASAADPATFQAVQVGNDRYVSGEVRGQLDVYEAVAQCRKMGVSDRYITVDVVYTGASKLEQKNVANDTSLVVMSRGDDIKAYMAAQSDKLYAQWTYPAVNWRYDVSPSVALTFNTTYYGIEGFQNMSKQGAKDALKAIAKVKNGVECDTARDAPTCNQDLDCKAWAAKACLKGAAIARQGRCLIAKGETNGQCSFDAKEIANHRAAYVTGKEGTCLGAAFSGGGDYGAYEAGVVKGLTSVGGCLKAGVACPFSWQVAAGVSVGSIVSAGLAKFPIGLEANAADFMVTTAIDGSGAAILLEWPEKEGEGCCLNRGLNFESGLLDNSGLRNLLTNSFPNVEPTPMKDYRKHTFTSTNMGTGARTVFHYQGSQGTPEFIDHLLASAAIQGVFPMIHIDGEYYGDGGPVTTIDAFAAIQTCRDIGYSDAQIQLDTISIAGYAQKVLPAGEAFTLTADEIAERVADIKRIDNFMSVIQDVRDAEPNMFRINQYPQSPLPGDGLNFNATQMSEMVKIGTADGVATANSLLTQDDSALPKACAYETTTVACGSDKDCFNWEVEKCNGLLKDTKCDHTARTCVFTE